MRALFSLVFVGIQYKEVAYLSMTTAQEIADVDSSSTRIDFFDYEDESQLPAVMKLVGQDLSEPYSSKFWFHMHTQLI